MIISHKFKFIFIKTRKTAGTSIEVFLSPLCGGHDILTPIFPAIKDHTPRNYGTFYNHISAAEIRAAVNPIIWKTYYKFCVERNPWDKTLSYYYMQKARSGNLLTLEEYFDLQDFCNDYSAYTEPSDSSQIIVDKVVCYEDLSMNLSKVFKRLGVPFNGDLGVRAKSEYRTNRCCYKRILTVEQAKIIEKKFQNEIKMFGYKY